MGKDRIHPSQPIIIYIENFKYIFLCVTLDKTLPYQHSKTDII